MRGGNVRMFVGRSGDLGTLRPGFGAKLLNLDNNGIYQWTGERWEGPPLSGPLQKSLVERLMAPTGFGAASGGSSHIGPPIEGDNLPPAPPSIIIGPMDNNPVTGPGGILTDSPGGGVLPCATQVSIAPPFDTGEHPIQDVPIGTAPPLGIAGHGLMLDFIVGVLGGTDIGYPLSLFPGGSAWTLLDSYAPAIGGRHLNAAVGALPIPVGGSTSPFEVTWTGHFSPAVYWRMIGLQLLTAAVAPVQIGSQLVGPGTTITLGAPPTAGNVLIDFFTGTIQNSTLPLTQTDLDALFTSGSLNVPWKLIKSCKITNDVGSVTHTTMAAIAHCVSPGDPAVLSVPATLLGGWWNFMSEWAFV